MILAASILMLALTRAELIERFKAPAITKDAGLVQVFADCPRDMREAYQSQVASFAAGVCRKLQAAARKTNEKFAEPGIVIYIGEERTNRTDVITRRISRKEGGRFTRIYLPAPGFSDIERFRLEVAKAYFLASDGKELDDAAAIEALENADPVLRVRRKYERLDKRLAGDGTDDDEECLMLARSIIEPGIARVSDVLRFASRLRLYPRQFASPFAGRFRDATFAEAIKLAPYEPRIRLAASEKASLVVAYGGGHGEELAQAADAYSRFLFELARFAKPQEELAEMLDEANVKLEIALEKARLASQDNKETWR